MCKVDAIWVRMISWSSDGRCQANLCILIHVSCKLMVSPILRLYERFSDLYEIFCQWHRYIIQTNLILWPEEATTSLILPFRCMIPYRLQYSIPWKKQSDMFELYHRNAKERNQVPCCVLHCSNERFLWNFSQLWKNPMMVCPHAFVSLFVSVSIFASKSPRSTQYFAVWYISASGMITNYTTQQMLHNKLI